jgi:hypothetical protein
MSIKRGASPITLFILIIIYKIFSFQRNMANSHENIIRFYGVTKSEGKIAMYLNLSLSICWHV